MDFHSFSRLSFFIILLLETLPVSTNAQIALPASGGQASGSGGTASYSVGQTAFHTYVGDNGSVAEGIQQPYEILVIDGIPEAAGISVKLSAFPNPVSDWLILMTGDITNEELYYILSDLNGKVLFSNNINSEETSIGLYGFPQGIYFLKIFENQQIIKTFKIIKN